MVAFDLLRLSKMTLVSTIIFHSILNSLKKINNIRKLQKNNHNFDLNFTIHNIYLQS